MGRYDVDVYSRRAERLGCRLLEIRQAHLGTDGGLALIKRLVITSYSIHYTKLYDRP